MLRGAEDRRQKGEASDRQNGQAVGPSRAQKRKLVEDAKNSIQILRYSVHGDGEDAASTTQPHNPDPPSSSSSRSNIADKSATTVLLGIRQAQGTIADGVESSAQVDVLKTEPTNADDTVGQAPDFAMRRPAGPTSSMLSAAPTPSAIPPMTSGSTTTLSDSTPRTSHDRVGEDSIMPALPTSNGAGATAAAAVKAGKAVKTTRFLF